MTLKRSAFQNIKKTGGKKEEQTFVESVVERSVLKLPPVDRRRGSVRGSSRPSSIGRGSVGGRRPDKL